MLWLILGAMTLAALTAVIYPLTAHRKNLSALALVITVLIAGGSSLLYWNIGTPEARSVPAGPRSIDDMVVSLAERLETAPDDVDGWKMLGRSYFMMRRYDESITAYERAVALENSSNPQTLADLGEAVFLNDNAALLGRAGQLFENAFALAPANPKALFYSGLAAAQRGDTKVAADRWDTLLATSPPPEIEDLLRQRIAEWRGEALTPVPATPTATVEPLTISVAVADAAAAEIDPNATVFVIARDPAQPSPPIAAVRRRANEFPGTVSLSDSDAMIPGRLISAFGQLEIVVRVSASGQPIAQQGDWFGRAILDTAASRAASVVIDQQVP